MSIKNDILEEALDSNTFISDSLADKFDVNFLTTDNKESVRERLNSSDKIVCNITCGDVCFNFDLVEMSQCDDIVDVVGELSTVVIASIVGKKDLKVSLLFGEKEILSSLESKCCYINKIKVKNSQISEIKVKFCVSKDN